MIKSLVERLKKLRNVLGLARADVSGKVSIDSDMAVHLPVVKRLMEDFTWDLALAIAGHPLEKDVLANKELLLNQVQPFLATGWAAQPNFAEAGALQVFRPASSDGNSVTTVMSFEDRCFRESPYGGGVPNQRRAIDVVSQLDVSAETILNYTLTPKQGSVFVAMPAALLTSRTSLLEAATESSTTSERFLPPQSLPVDPTPQGKWPVCCAAGCDGVRVGSSDRCLGHLEPEQLLSHLRKANGTIDARGVSITEELFDTIIEEGLDSDGAFTSALFDFAKFLVEVRFDTLRFGEAPASFQGARFARSVSFSRSRFANVAIFTDAVFVMEATFQGATFAAAALFERALFKGVARFSGASFQGGAAFESTTFMAAPEFRGASFTSDTRSIYTEWFIKEATFAKASFKTPTLLGPMSVIGMLVLDEASFEGFATLEVRAKSVSCFGTHFRAGGNLRVRWAEILLEEARFDAPSTLEAFGFTDNEFEYRLRDATGGNAQAVAPRLVSVRGTDASNLTLIDVDLSACLFYGAINLDQLRLEGRTTFALSPSNHGLARRRVVAEEYVWRAGTKKDPGRFDASSGTYISYRSGGGDEEVDARQWSPIPPRIRAPAWVGSRGSELAAEDVASVYRALRKGREDLRDGPGAGDFYYGEMEMRRNIRPEMKRQRRTEQSREGEATVDGAEQTIIWLYWLIAGYGLRPSRAIVSLGVTLILLAVPLFAVGITKEPSGLDRFAIALLTSSEGLLSVFGDLNPARVNAWGEAIEVLSRIVGAALIFLIALSLRGRIQR